MHLDTYHKKHGRLNNVEEEEESFIIKQNKYPQRLQLFSIIIEVVILKNE